MVIFENVVLIYSTVSTSHGQVFQLFQPPIYKTHGLLNKTNMSLLNDVQFNSRKKQPFLVTINNPVFLNYNLRSPRETTVLKDLIYREYKTMRQIIS